MEENKQQNGVKNLFEIQFDLLKVELNLIDKTIRAQDDITKSIKNWAIVTWTASMGVSLSDVNLHQYIWLVAIIPIMFWSVDALFRRIQTTFIARCQDIANYINSDNFRNEAKSGSGISMPLLIMRDRPANHKDWLHQYLMIARYFSISFLYIGLIIVSLVVWFVIFIIPIISKVL